LNNRRVVIGIFVSFILIYLIIWIPRPGGLFKGELSIFQAAFGQPRIDFTNLGRILLHLKPIPLILGFLVTPIHCLVRSHRWGIMVKHMSKLKLFDGFSIIMVSYFTNSILPLRIGEVVRGVLLGRRIKITNSAGLGTVALDRALDMVSLLVVIIITGLLFDFPAEIGYAAWLLSAISLIMILIIAAMILFKERHGNLPNRLLEWLPVGIGRRILSIINQFISGFAALKSPANYFLIVADSVIIWGLYAAQVLLVMIAFNLPANYPVIAAEPVMTSFVILVIAALVLSVPSAPGGIGTFHAAVIFGLALFGVGTDEAAGFAFIIHAITIIFYIFVGFPFMWREGLKLVHLRSMRVDGG